MGRTRQLLTIALIFVAAATPPLLAQGDSTPAATLDRLSYEAVRRVVMGRTQFMPHELIVVDRCSLAQYLEAAAVDSLMRSTQHSERIKYRGCGSTFESTGSETHWAIAGVIGWWPSTIIAADVTHPAARTKQRETYTITEGQLATVTLSHYGVFH